ncbi:hypothetical protein P4475_07430 [Halalkalibacterium halodurans]|jgi:hypothetical protein|uniref:hypothetical protein n=1 Tax=Halalkalibacterium halodurans TaxID=86665 RepID=UPI002E1D0ACE|nr:hypothetical protein [Halalkalibacterium halodurans]
MKKVTKSLVVWGLAFGLVFGVGTVGAMYVDSKTHNGFYVTGTLKKTAKIWFNPSWETDNSYGMEKGKHVKQSYVRITEGDYDSGRKWTSTAKSKTENKEYSRSITKTNNPAKTMKANYGWRYF